MNSPIARCLPAALALLLAAQAASAQDAAMAAGAPAAAGAETDRMVSPDIVISQVYGGGGNSGATYTHDFIELFNRGASPVDVSTWSVQYASATGSTWSNRTNLSGIIGPGQYYLIQQAQGAGGTQPLPTPDATGTIAMAAASGKVALVTNQVNLACGTSCAANPAVRDFVGYGSANDFEGTAAPILTNTTAALRAAGGCTDTDSNGSDFTAVAPIPRNSARPANGCGGPTPPTGVGAANPPSVPAGGSTLLTVAVTPGANPTSTGLTVTGDLTAIGGPAAAPLFDDGTNGDVTAGDLTFSLDATVAPGTPSGPRVITFTIADAQLRSSTATATVTVPAVVALIHQIQGTGARSPLEGQLVTAHGIVTARKLNGFFMQLPDAEADSDPATSEGIFVFTSTAPPAAAAVGNDVEVTGTVQEFVPSQDPVSPPMTELAFQPTVTVLSTGNLRPDPVAMAPSPDIPGQLFEHLEGMRVLVDTLTAVSPTDGFVSEPNATSTSNGLFYGVLTGTPRPFREPGINILDPLPPGAPPNIPRFDENTERIRVDSDGQEGGTTFEVSSGMVLPSFPAVVDYAFRTYTVLPDPGHLTVDQVGAATPVRPLAADEFTVAAFNLERFFDTANDPDIGEPVLTAAALERRLAKASLAIRTVMRKPDVLGVAEVENLALLQTLATRINDDAVAAGDPDPAYVAHLVEGNDPGGIDVGFLVRTERVAVVGVQQEGLTATYINPQTGLPELLNDRPPLVLRAAVSVPGGPAFPFTVVVNHLRSLIGVDDPADGVRVRAKRAAQAEFLAQLVDDLQEESPRAAVVTLGDFNAFEVNDGYVDVMGAVKGDPAPADEVVHHADDFIDPDLVNLVETVTPASGQRYSYVFDGNAQVLDHVLVTQTLTGKFRELQYARNDADFPESLRNDETRPERLSDHDMPVAFFRHPSADLGLAKTASAAVSGQPVTYTITATNAGPDPAEQVVVTDPLPALTTFEAVSAPGWSCTAPPVGSNGTVSCSRAEVAAGATILVSARVACAVANGTMVTNTASAASIWDPVPGNNAAGVTVSVSNPPPAIANLAANPSVIAPSRAWVDVTVNYDATDNCDPAPSCALTVTSNQAGPGGVFSGPDWTIVDDHHVRVRAARNAGGQPRVYTVRVTCTDSVGQTAMGTTTVTVQ
jgi:uncharacterized repeat protein (TIGR01451 family)